jgi:hypothetical protein
MSKQYIPKLTGAALAIAAAGLAGAESMSGSESGKTASTAAAATVDLVHCYGVNVCGGHNDCKTAANACAGHASCKGTGFVGMPAKACADVGGTQKDSWTGSIAKTDLIHCSGVNVCGGHNDCKTANNACAGHASCKGTGFVATPEKACKDIGGKVS